MDSNQLKDLFSEMLTAKIDQPWEKPWFCPMNKFNTVTNYITGKQYKNGNFLFLLIVSSLKNFQVAQFMTYKQGLKLGYMVNRGSKGLPVYYYNFKYYKEDGNKKVNLPSDPYNSWDMKKLAENGIKRLPFIKIHHVFNVSQFSHLETGENLQSVILRENFDEIPDYKVNRNPDELIPSCEELITEWECPINFVTGSNRCFYSHDDFIQLVDRLQFLDNESFYSTLIHEVTHSTGHEKRTNRLNYFKGMFEDHDSQYAIEELVAELASAFIMAANNFHPEKQRVNAAIYIQGWKKAIEDDTDLAFRVCNETYKAILYIHERFPNLIPFFGVDGESKIIEETVDAESEN